jgi:hypothetical protein
MANSITFTSNAFASTTQFATASAATASGYTPTTTNTFYDIGDGPTSYDRRIYGVGVTSTDTANIQTITVALNDGIKDIRIYQGACPVNSGNTTAIVNFDLYSTANASAVFAGQADGNGVTYFNLKSGWSLKASYGTALTGSRLLIFTTFGETYE